MTKWYPMGKTSMASSLLNIPGRLAWVTMEVPGMAMLLYCMKAIPHQQGIERLPFANRLLGGMFVRSPNPLAMAPNPVENF